mgnify:CR=1 FL=1
MFIWVKVFDIYKGKKIGEEIRGFYEIILESSYWYQDFYSVTIYPSIFSLVPIAVYGNVTCSVY